MKKILLLALFVAACAPVEADHPDATGVYWGSCRLPDDTETGYSLFIHDDSLYVERVDGEECLSPLFWTSFNEFDLEPVTCGENMLLAGEGRLTEDLLVIDMQLAGHGWLHCSGERMWREGT